MKRSNSSIFPEKASLLLLLEETRETPIHQHQHHPRNPQTEGLPKPDDKYAEDVNDLYKVQYSLRLRQLKSEGVRFPSLGCRQLSHSQSRQDKCKGTLGVFTFFNVGIFAPHIFETVTTSVQLGVAD